MGRKLGSKLTQDKCVFCGKPLNKKTRTWDHTPPKCLFPRGQNLPLITVPSCRSCNQEESKDVEYFRLVIGFSREVEGGEASSANQALGSLTMPLSSSWPMCSRSTAHSNGVRPLTTCPCAAAGIPRSMTDGVKGRIFSCQAVISSESSAFARR